MDRLAGDVGRRGCVDGQSVVAADPIDRRSHGHVHKSRRRQFFRAEHEAERRPRRRRSAATSSCCSTRRRVKRANIAYKAIDALKGFLAGLTAGDRVRLVAVDLNAIPLTKTFVAPNGKEMAAALAALDARVPLGRHRHVESHRGGCR